jgi:hypothetical protein
MIKRDLVFLFLLTLGLLACKNGSRQQPPVVKDDPILSKSPVYQKLIQELDSTEIFDDEIIYGYWFKPHEASAVNIFFHKNGTFEFKYYIVENDTTIIDVVKKGTYTIGDEDVNKTCLIKMEADDGWDNQVFDGIIYRKHNRTNYYMTNKGSGLYLVKGCD